MSRLTPTQDAELFTDVVLRVLEAVAPAQAEEDAFVAALTTLDLDTITKVSAYKFGVLLSHPMRPVDLAGLKDEVLASAGAAGGLTDNATLARLVFGLADGCSTAWTEQKAKQSSMATGVLPPGSTPGPAAPRVSDEELERKECASAYDDYERLQAACVDLPHRATFVAAARTSIKAYGYIAEVPRIESVRTYGTSSTRRQKVNLGDAVLSFGEKQVDLVGGIPGAHQSTRILLDGLGAAGSLPIDAGAYNGREVGWVAVPGRSDQVRLLFPRDAIEKFKWALVGIATSDPTAYLVTANSCVEALLTQWARLRLHPSEIIDDMVSAKPHLFIPRSADVPTGGTPARDPDAVTEAGSSTSGQSGSQKLGVCESWLQGGCRNIDSCPFNHPARLRGNSSRPKGGGGGARWGGGGGWAAQSAGWGGDWGGQGWGNDSSNAGWGGDWGGPSRRRGTRGKGNGDGKGKGWKGKGGPKGKGW
jgi:hypothetical protein